VIAVSINGFAELSIWNIPLKVIGKQTLFQCISGTSSFYLENGAVKKNNIKVFALISKINNKIKNKNSNYSVLFSMGHFYETCGENHKKNSCTEISVLLSKLSKIKTDSDQSTASNHA
jgi:hypothetical protein